MLLIDLTYSDRKILKQLQHKGLTVNEAISLIMCKIYYLNYKDRELMKKAINLIGENRKDYIVSAIQLNKRNIYLEELRENNINNSNDYTNDLLAY